MMTERRREGEGAPHGECGCSSLRVREWMLTMNSHGVEISIAGYVAEMVRDPNPMPRGSPYIGVLPSTLTLCDSYSPLAQLMTPSESYSEIHGLTHPHQLALSRNQSNPIKEVMCLKGVTCMKPMTYNYESCARYINHMTTIVRHVKYQPITINQ